MKIHTKETPFYTMKVKEVSNKNQKKKKIHRPAVIEMAVRVSICNVCKSL